MARSWDEVATRLVVERGDALSRYAYLLTGSVDDAADLVQDALVRTFGTPRFGLTLPRAEAYVRRAILNQVIDRSRRDGTWRRVRHLAVAPATVDSSAAASDERLDLFGRVRELPPRQAACIVLRYYDDLRSTASPACSASARAPSSGISATGSAHSPPRSIRPERVPRGREARMSAPDPTGLGEDLKRAADAATPRPVDVDAVLAASRSRRRARRTAVVTGAGAVAAVLVVGGLVFGLQRPGGDSTTADAPIMSESAGSAETAPEIASGESADDAAGLRLAAPEAVNRCGATVVPLADATDAPLAVAWRRPPLRCRPGATAIRHRHGDEHRLRMS